MNQSNANQNSAAAPAANPVTPQQVQLQQPTVHQFQQSIPVVEQAPAIEPILQHSSDNTSNDEIQELLVSVLEELCTIKSAIFELNARDQDDQEDPEGGEPMGETASSAGRVEAKAQYPESVNTDLFASCFQE